MSGNVYLCIDLKSFYASAECVARGLDPMRTNLVVADASRTQKTICLAVSPALKSYGLPGRLRLFEVEQRVKDINYDRRQKNGGRGFRGKSWNKEELERDPFLELDYIVAAPRMAYYMECSGKIYRIYLNHIAPEDIHVYSIDEVFIDLTPYLDLYKTTPRELASRIIQEVYEKTAITATAGLGSNLYLAKIAMDILAKCMPADERGACIAELDEMSYREQLWGHQPITDFWRIGRGYAKKLNDLGLYTMGDIARYSLQRQGEDTLYKVFGVNAELLIDHAWGWEPCGMQDIKNYRPEHKSFGSGQVLQYAYPVEKARIVAWEMVDRLVLDLVDKKMVADQFVLTIGYDIDNLSTKEKREKYKGEIVMDHYGRHIPKHAHGTVNLKEHCNSMQRIGNAVMKLFDDIVDRNLLVRRITIAANHVLSEKEAEKRERFEQLDLFRELEMLEREKAALEKERHLQKAVLKVQKKYGKNALLKGTNFMEGATMQSRNRQIGGHKA